LLSYDALLLKTLLDLVTVTSDLLILEIPHLSRLMSSTPPPSFSILRNLPWLKSDRIGEVHSALYHVWVKNSHI